MAKEDKRPVLERMSAVAALGILGDRQDLDFLRELSAQAGLDARLMTAVNFSLGRLENRLKGM